MPTKTTPAIFLKKTTSKELMLCEASFANAPITAKVKDAMSIYLTPLFKSRCLKQC